MKITLVNTDDSSGGAAVACRRLMYALNTQDDTQAQLLAQKGKIKDDNIHHIATNKIKEAKVLANIALERLAFKPYHNGEINSFYFSPANIGMDISNHQAIKSADIIHLHWINLGFLSIKSLQQLAALNKPIVWTLHDMWAFTGGCHYSGDCTNYLNECGNCERFLKNPSENDLSRKINLKKSFFKNFNFVTCSHWLKDEALKSSLLRDVNVISIPNPIDTNFFQPLDKKTSRSTLNLRDDVQYILFGAANLNDDRKGLQYLLDAIELLAQKENSKSIELLLFGKANKDELNIPMKINELGSISSMEKMRDVYNAADLFIIPSLQDNLPNTIMESMACGTPVVGFNTGGIPEMIDHKENGYIATYKDASDLINGIFHTLDHQVEFGKSARKKVLDNYTEDKVAKKYIEFYQSIM